MWLCSQIQHALSCLVIALLLTPSLCSVELNSGSEQTSVLRSDIEDASNVTNSERFVAENKGHDLTDDTNCSAKVISTVTVVSMAIVSEKPTQTSFSLRHTSVFAARKRAAEDVAISANGTINSNALSCYSTYSHWWRSYKDWYSTAIDGKNWSTTSTTTTLLQTLTSTATIYPSTGLSTYKLCDGSVRIDQKPLTLTSPYVSSYAYEDVVTVGTPTYSAPPCTSFSVDCEYLYYNTNISWTDPTLLGLCGSPAHLGLPCLIGGGPVQLAYFPVTTVDGDKCGSNGSTVTNTGGPTTISALGTVLTSGSVYLSFQTLYAYQEGFGNRIGPAFTDFILPLPSNAISTQCGGWFSAQGTGTPLNYADWNSPIPASAYKCMNRCTTQLQYTQVNNSEVRYTPPSQCNTIWNDFDPILAIPTEVRDLVPAWSTCSFYDAALPNFLFDPPIALKEGTTVATPTPDFDTGSTTTAASPASTTYTALAETQAPTTTTTTSTPSPEGIVITFTIDDKSFTASQARGAFAIDGTTVSVGGNAQVIQGETISLGLAGFVVNAATTVPFSGTDTVTGTSETATETSGSSSERSSGAESSSSSRATSGAASASYVSSAMGGSATSTSGAGKLDTTIAGLWMLVSGLGLVLLL